MGLMACNALDYLVAVAMQLDVDAREDGVYLKDGTRWQPTVNWAQIGPLINKFDMGFEHIQDRYQPVMAMHHGSAGVTGETHQVAACNYVVWRSNTVMRDTQMPYVPVNSMTLKLRDEEFKKKYPYLKIDDIERIERINEVGVATYLKESAERHKRWMERCPSSLVPYSLDRGPELINTIVTHYPELITVEAHAKELPC